MLKIFDGEKVYIPVSEIKKNGPQVTIPSSYLVSFGELGNAIPEEKYNLLLSKGNALDNPIELTKVVSLSYRLEQDIKLRPLKYMFLKGVLKESDAAIEAKLTLEEKQSKDNIIKEILSKKSHVSEQYLHTVSMLEENKEYISRILKDNHLKLQVITEVSETKHVGIIGFLVGENVFYEVYLHDWDLGDFDRISVDQNDSLTIPQPQEYEDDVLRPDKTLNMDFRNNTVFENLLWCLTHMDVKNDVQDEINVRDGAVSFFIDIKLLAKLLNKNAFPETTFLPGLVQFSEKTT